MWHLGYDPPPADLLRDDAPWTDEGTISRPALLALESGRRCSTLAFRGGRSIHQMALCGFFRCFGSHKEAGRWLSVFVSLLGVAALGRIGEDVWTGVGAVYTAGLAAIGFFFVAFDRNMLTEGGLAALMSLCVLCGIRSKSRAHAAAVGVGVGLLAMGFKYHALALVPSLFLFYFLRRRTLSWTFLLSVIITVVGWRMILVPDLPVTRALDPPSRVSHPTMGLASPGQVLPRIWYAGIDARFFLYQLPLLFFVALEMIVFLSRPRQWLAQASSPVLVAATWFVVTLIGVGVFKYGPSRYYHLISPPFLVLSVAGMQRLWRGKLFAGISYARRLLITLTLGVWLQMQVFPPLPLFGEWEGWVPLLGAPLPLLVFWLLSRSGPEWCAAQRFRRVLGGILLLSQVGIQSALYWEGIARSRPDLLMASKSTAEHLGPRSIVVGRLAGTMAISGGFDNLPMLELVTMDRVAHLAEDSSVWVVVIEGEEDRLEASLWPKLELVDAYPIRFMEDADELTLWRFDGQTEPSG